MKSISPELAADIESSSLTLAYCWKMVLKNGVILGFTTWDRKFTYDGLEYIATSGLSTSDLVTSTSLSVDNSEATLFINDLITENDIRKGLYDSAKIYCFQINPTKPENGILKLASGNLGEGKILGQQVVFEFRSLAQRFTQTFHRTYTTTCQAEVGDSKCQVDTSLYEYNGTVTSLTNSDRFIADANLVEVDDYFRGSILVWLTGANTGLRTEIMRSATGTLEALSLTLYPIQVGDTYTIYAGCDKLHATCKEKFDNFINFRGFPHIIPRDQLVASARQ